MKKRLILLGLWLLCGVGGLLVWLYQLTQVVWATDRCWRMCLQWDDLGNAALGGQPDETLSTKCALACRQGKWWGRLACRLLDAVDPGHCAQAVAFDAQRKAVK